MTAIQITTDGTITYPTPPEAGESYLEFLQEAVGGRIEAVDLTDKITMYINEEGKMHNLSENRIATNLAWAAQTISMFDYIAGNAIIVGFDYCCDENRPLTEAEKREVQTEILLSVLA